MATYTVKAPDGKTITLQGPDGASQTDIIAQAQKLYKPAAPAPATNDYLDKYNSIRNGLVAGVTDPTQRNIRLTRFDSDPRAQQLRKLAGLAPLSTAQGDVQAVAKKSVQQRVADAGADVGQGSTALQSASAGISRGMFGIPEMLAAAGERFLPSAITGNNTDASYSNILQMIRSKDTAAINANPTAGIGGEVGGSIVGAGAAGRAIGALAGRAAASGSSILANAGRDIQEVGTLRKGAKLANTAKLAVIGAGAGGAQAAGEGSDIPTGAAEGAVAAPVVAGAASSIGKFLLRPAADILDLSNAASYLKRFTSATTDQIQQKLTDFRAKTGAEPTLLELLPLADRNKLIQNTVAGRDPAVEQASNAIRERTANVQPEMQDVVQGATQGERLKTQRAMVQSLTDANGGTAVPGDNALALKASQSPTDMLRLRRVESQRIMAPHDASKVVDNFSDLIPQHPQSETSADQTVPLTGADGSPLVDEKGNPLTKNVPGKTTISMIESDPEASRAIRSVAGALPARKPGEGVNVQEVTNMISDLREDAAQGGIDGRAADRAAQHLIDLMQTNVPEAAEATQQMRNAYAAHSRMAEGMGEGWQQRLRDEIQVGTNNSRAQSVQNAYDTDEGTAGRQLGTTNRLASDLSGTPQGAASATIDLARSGNPAVTENLGQNAGDKIQTAAGAQARSLEALASAGRSAQNGDGTQLKPNDITTALLAMGPHPFAKARILGKLASFSVLPAGKAKVIVDMLLSQDPTLTSRAVKALGNERGGAKFLKYLAATAGQLTADANAPDHTTPPEEPTDADGTADAGAEAPVEAQEAPATVMGYPVVTNPDKSTWDKRADGSTKGTGFLGLLQRPDGNVSSEISVGVGINGKETEIPLMVPGLSKSELDYLMTHDPASSQFQKNMPRSILDKATAHATARINAGLSPFKQDDESAATPPASASPYAPALLQIYQNENPDLIHLIQRVKKQESSGDQSKVSKKGAVGVMQVMPGTGPEAAKLAGVQWDPKAYKEDPSYNELIGIAYLSQLLRKYKGDVARALAAYNAGPGKADTAIADHGENFLSAMPAETQDYVARVGS